MTTQLNPQDWQTISAYLDGQLSKRDKAQFEARLQSQPELRKGLEEIQRTRMLLRSLPQRRAPRNFTLSPSMVPKRYTIGRFFPSLRLASALASFLLMLAFAGQFVLGRNILAMAVATQAPALQSAPSAAQTLKGAQPPAIIVWGTPTLPVIGMGGGGGDGGYGGGSGGSGQPEGYSAAPAATVPPSLAAAPATQEAGEAAKPGATEQSPQEIAPLEAQPTPSSAPTTQALAQNDRSATGNSPILGVRPPSERGTAVAQQPAGALRPAVPDILSVTNFHIAEVLLALIAIGTGLAAYLIHRRVNL
jgi:hypothetical protein